MHASQKINQPIGIIAGGGALPALLAAHLTLQGKDVRVVRLTPFCDDLALQHYAGIDARMDKMGAIFEYLRAQNVRDVVLIGHVKRPDLWALRPDFTTLCMLPDLLVALLGKGDDALLRAVRKVVEKNGFNLVGMRTLMADLLAPKGAMGAHLPGPQAEADIEHGWQAALAHGEADKGQAIVVQRGMILDVEGRAGTDALIAHAGTLRVPMGAQPVLVKTVKPGQDQLIDLPTVGVHTVQNCFDAGFAGIAVEAGGVLMVDRDAMVRLADALGLFIVGR